MDHKPARRTGWIAPWLLIAAGLAAGAAGPASPPAPAPAPARDASWWETPASQLVFFAVLEGLYEDGVSLEDLDRILPRVPHGRRDMYAHFVYTCPLCHPTYEAMSLYCVREPFYGQKGAHANTFCKGLDAGIRQRLASKTKAERLAAVRELVERWVSRRLDRMRLTADERQAWEKQVASLRDRGTEALKGFKAGANGDFFTALYADWEACSACEGSLGACKRKAGH